MNRCKWATNGPLLLHYHDTEWGIPEYDTHELFRKLSLEIFQAGLSWNLILKKENDLDRIFHSFDYGYLSHHQTDIYEAAMNDKSGIRNQAKISAILHNAQVMADLEDCEIDIFKKIWAQVGFVPLDHLNQNDNSQEEMKPFLAKFKAIFDEYGFKRIGTTTLHSFIQAVGIVNDHEVGCFLHESKEMAGEDLFESDTTVKNDA